MPRIDLQDPFGTGYRICTRRVETTLKAWFDEILPYTYVKGDPMLDDFEFIWPRVIVYPMWAWGAREADPDWLVDSRMLGRSHLFPARNGDEGLVVLLKIRRQLEAELEKLRR